MQRSSSYRRILAYLTSFSTSQVDLKSPWMVAFFSFAYPGFGNLLQHRYFKGFLLMGWEIFINYHAQVNLGIMYTLQGHFERAKEVLDERWLLMYVGIYMYAIWDGYRSTVDLNKFYILANREDAQIPVMKVNGWDMNFLDKRKPWVAAAWSILVPGAGHLYIHKVIAGFVIFIYTVIIVYFSHLMLGIQYTMTGRFAQSTQVLDMQWLLYLPSIYIFIIYDGYTACVEYNKLFEKEQKKFLKDRYQHRLFKFPV